MQDIEIEAPHIDGTPRKTISTPYRTTPAGSTATPLF